MVPCERLDDSWQVVVCDDSGNITGAGVLLGDKWVLTCAHLAGDVGARLKVQSVLCRPRWSRHARVRPDCWVSETDTQRGDLALLELASPVKCHKGARLRRAPVRDVAVRVRGFPDRDKIGACAEGRLTGAANGGEWVEIAPRADNRGQWVTAGFSGAGVVADASGDVIGIIMAVRGANPAVVAYMTPVETIIDYLPFVRQFAVGGSTRDPIFRRHSDRLTDATASGAATPREAAVDVALRQQIGRLFTGAWSGTAVVTGGDPDAGSPWLASLVATADPAVRRRISGAAIAQAPPGAVLDVGAIDLAIDAGGCSVERIRRRIAERFQFPDGDCADLVTRLLHHQPAPTLVIDRVDGAKDAAGLMASLVKPLAAAARRRGLRIVLGFAVAPPAGLRHEISLGPEPVTGTAGGPATADEVRRLITDLAYAEEELATLYAHVSDLVPAALVPRPGIAPWLRARHAIATSGHAPGGRPTAELALIGGRAGAAKADTVHRLGELRELGRTYGDLGHALENYRLKAERLFGSEDRRLGEFYGRTLKALRAVPFDRAAARAALEAYADAIARRERAA
jgi:hypothetical protein